jgi:hypothetical protein
MKTYTQEEMDEVILKAYEKGREDGYDAASKNYEYEGY